MGKYQPALLFLGMALVLGIEKAPKLLMASEADVSPSGRPVGDARREAAKIDRFLAQRWADQKILPVAPAGDAEWLRRIYLDLIGRIPSVSEVRDFLEDPRKDKRQRLVDRLLHSLDYVRHFTNVWREAWLPESNALLENPGIKSSFEAWLHGQLLKNAPYDQMVRTLITFRAPGANSRKVQDGMPSADGTTPQAFYQANENKPENLGASTSRIFLGVKLECAQCHHHPFADWKKEQFWEYAAFFAGPPQGGAPGKIKIPSTDTFVNARFLDGSFPQAKDMTNPRTTLADWMTAPTNKYFARAVVNRLWSHFFGTGLMEPVDNLSDDGENKELLDELARDFTEHGFDLKFLIGALVNSKAYQLSSGSGQAGPDAESHWARMPVRGLSPEQLFDSLREATGYQEPLAANQRRGSRSARAEFLAQFTNQHEKRTEMQTSILQALALMNSKFTADATSVSRSETLAAVIDAPFLDSAGRIETLFLATLSRPPDGEERTRLLSYVGKGGPSGNSKQALADVFWALLNSSEFFLNH
ncbi:MAG TPA: DUF1549 and DUF1553 domain-containing protein [Gemmataceae bacterium]|nr:DUF1549 and DUF1553 domain-containing protein [Gemmataceae bacterium]